MDPVKYNPDPTDPKWTDEAFRLAELGKAAGGLDASVDVIGGIETSFVSGACPYCHDQLTDVQVREAVTEGSGKVAPTDEGADEYRTVVVKCGCQVSHPEDPTKGKGCGTIFKIEVLPS